MTALMFPALAGQGWSVHKRPTFSTRVATHSSGREARAPLYAFPLYEFEVNFEALASDDRFPGLGASSFQSVLGLFLQCQGRLRTFLYTDPEDCRAVGQHIATGDGQSASFSFVRALGGFVEPVSWVTSVSNINLDGVAQTAGWTLASPNMLRFTTAPAAQVEITADFTFAYECRFLDDQNDFENFMAGLWQAQSLKFRSVKP